MTKEYTECRLREYICYLSYLSFLAVCPDYMKNHGMNPNNGSTKEEHEYIRICQNLPEIPTIIPEQVTTISIQGNEDIILLEANAFRKNSMCRYLQLSWNRIDTISIEAFSGLNALKRIFLRHNRIQAIRNGTFSQNVRLETVDLSFNEIQIIEAETFAKLALHNSLELNLESNALVSLSRSVFASSLAAKRIKLDLAENSLSCDHRTCWIKRAEQDGWLTWLKPESSKPKCLENATILDTCGSK